MANTRNCGASENNNNNANPPPPLTDYVSSDAANYVTDYGKHATGIGPAASATTPAA
jgi:hypothetical protein